VLKQSRELGDRLKTLEKKLAKAIAEEDFETAATVRDELKQTARRQEFTV
jgi:protein-arginine kinase activator protein McsA